MRVVTALAARRHGVVTTRELAFAGLSPDAIAHRVHAGTFRRLHRGVYLVGPLTGPLTKEMAALLACGSRAVLSHATAAAIWGLRAELPAIVHLSVAGNLRGHDGVRVHRVAALDPADVAHRDGCRLTTPVRTLADLAPHLPQRELDRAIEQAQVLRLATRRDLLTHLPSRISSALHEPALTRSEAERRLLELIRAAQLPPPRTNARVGPYEVDFLWPEQRLVVEVDGFAYHSTRAAFERDRLRDASLQAADHRVMRVTWRQIAHERVALIARLAAALARA
jgi:very-short-patch-repair endonuclease